MREILFIILCVGLYVFASYKLHGLLLRVNAFFFLILSAAYVIGSFYLFSAIVYLSGKVNLEKFHLDLGHESSLMVKILFLWLGIAFINLITVCARRFRKK